MKGVHGATTLGPSPRFGRAAAITVAAATAVVAPRPPLRLLGEQARQRRVGHARAVSQEDLWGQILAAKAAASAEYAETLKSTSEDYLVEYDRGAKRRSLAGDTPFWTGIVDDDGTLHGENFMGRCQMRLRAKLVAEA